MWIPSFQITNKVQNWGISIHCASFHITFKSSHWYALRCAKRKRRLRHRSPAWLQRTPNRWPHICYASYVPSCSMLVYKHTLTGRYSLRNQPYRSQTPPECNLPLPGAIRNRVHGVSEIVFTDKKKVHQFGIHHSKYYIFRQSSSWIWSYLNDKNERSWFESFRLFRRDIHELKTFELRLFSFPFKNIFKFTYNMLVNGGCPVGGLFLSI